MDKIKEFVAVPILFILSNLPGFVATDRLHY